MKLYSIHDIKLSLLPWLCDPTDVAGCIYWLRASVGVETSDAQGSVKSWTDQVQHLPVGPIAANHAPKHLDFVPQLNGLAGVAFHEGTQMLHKVGGIPLPWGEQPFSMFAMCSPENRSHDQQVNSVLAMWAGTIAHAGLRFSSLGEFQAWVESLYGSGAQPETFAPHVVGIVFDGQGTLKLFVDGALAASHGGLFVAAQDAGDVSILAVGADTMNSEGFRGHIGDLAIYDRALSDDDVRFLTVALQAHYKLYYPWLGSIVKALAGGAKRLLNYVKREIRLTQLGLYRLLGIGSR